MGLVEMSKDMVEMSVDINNTDRIMLIGPPKAGKTVAAATYSAQCPDVLPAKELTNLEDTLIWQFDEEGSKSLTYLNLNAPVIDFTKCKTFQDLQKKLKEAMKYTAEAVASGKVNVVIIDTLTSYDHALVGHYGGVYPEKKDSMALYNNVKLKHQVLQKFMRSLDCSYILIAHTKTVHAAVESTEAATRAKAQNLATGGDIVAAITGGGATLWKAAVSYIWPVLAKKVKGQQLMEHYVLPRGGQGFEGGGRFPFLADKEPAHLGLLFKKINSYGETK